LLSRLKDGDTPDWAVFIDGGNDVAQLALQHDEPIFTPAVKRLWSAYSSGQAAAESTLKWIPMVRLAQAVARRLPASQANSTAVPTDQYQLITSDAHLSLQEKDAIVEYVVAHYVSNMRIVRAVCHEFTVRCLFVWAPSPAYKYDKKLHKTFPFEGE